MNWYRVSLWLIAVMLLMVSPLNVGATDDDADGMDDDWGSSYGLNNTTDDSGGDSDGDGLTNWEENNTYHTNWTNPDTDGDGMPDGWEVEYGLDPLVNDSGLDPDMDNLTNLEEYETNTWVKGYIKLYRTDPRNNDTDGDNMTDGWEIEYGMNATDPNDAYNNPDNDMLYNINEFLLGTDPLNNDTDGDGMWDGWEVKYGLNPLDPSDAREDPDHDGFTNVMEFHMRTDPTHMDIRPPPDAPSSTPDIGFEFYAIVILLIMIIVVVVLLFFSSGDSEDEVRKEEK